MRTKIQLRFADVDMARHVHNGAYLHFFELARMALLGTFIGKDHDWRTEGLILARNEVDYRKPIHLSDHVEVDCWCSAIGTKSFTLDYAVDRMKDGKRERCADGKSVMVCMNYVAGKTISCCLKLGKPLWKNTTATS
ncbi:MAG: acyl-CoA thioesterase [Flavobacteriales bacterium]|nr:acyl-CoA thioesterase [Flavobacteriales bacterium]